MPDSSVFANEVMASARFPRVRRFLRHLPLEAVLWTVGLALMASLDPTVDGPTWCLFERVGLTWCPGHGLGHSIAYLARGAFAASFAAHPLGGPTVVILTARIVRLVRDAARRAHSSQPILS